MNHLREACQRFGHTAHLAGNVHIPHLIAVAGAGAALLLCALALDVGAVVQSVPHPKPHILSYQQGFLGDGFVIDVVGDVDEAGQLFVDAVVRCPHPLLVVVRAIHLYQGTVLGGNGVKVTVAVVLEVLLVVVEVLPCSLHLAQLGFGGEVACFPVAAQLLVIDKGAFLAGAQLVHHRADILFQLLALVFVGTRGVGHGHGAHIVPAAVAFQLRGGGVPSVGFGITLGGQSVGVAVVVQLLLHV